MQNELYYIARKKQCKNRCRFNNLYYLLEMSSKFKNLTVRYSPEKEISERIMAVAKHKHRSASQQALHYIEKGLEKDELLEEESLVVERMKEELVDKLLEYWKNNK